jgi:ADP-heptose:LPS heptosyltransferase
MWRTTLSRRFRYVYQYCLDTLLVLTKKETAHPDRVLLIRVDAIGDFILWLDAAKATVKHYKSQGKRVTLIANAAWAAWAKELAVFDEVIALDRSRFNSSPRYRYRIERSIQALGCSIAVQPTYSREWLFGDALVRISGATERIGSIGCPTGMLLWQQRISDRSYTRLISADPTPYMELIRNAEFVRGLGEPAFRAKVADLRESSDLRIDESFIAAIPADRQYYVLFPGASWDGKQWTLGNFARVAEWLHSKTGWHGVVCGGPADRELSERLCKQCEAPLLDWAGRTDLPQMAAILSQAQCLLANDTSAPHIAAALGVPTVCVLGGGQFARFMPYQVEQRDDRPLPRTVIHRMACFDCNWECIYQRPNGRPVPCIEKITVAEISETIRDLLGLSA